MPEHPQRFWLAALLVAWSVDFLFWNKPVGISLMIFVVLALAAAFWLARVEKIRPVWAGPVLAAAVLLAAGVTVFRVEPMTRFLNASLAVGLLLLLAVSWRSVNWLRFGILDWVVTAVDVFADMLTRAASLRLLPAAPEGTEKSGLRTLGRLAPVLRGLLLALPVVAVLALLLSSADPIFSDRLTNFFNFFNLQRLPEYFIRLVYILILAYGFAGISLYALLPREQVRARSLSKDLPRILGLTEALIVLGSVNLLFAFFVTIQFQYFFGGQANITTAGYTYADYARRGFFELVIVAVLSLMLSLTLGAFTRRETPRQRGLFTGFSVLLVALVWVMLVSAFMRLLMYEDAYGFTRLRTYTHIFIPWLGLLLLAAIILQVARRERYFGPALLVAGMGFCLSLGAVNVDGFIARQNLSRAAQGADLDMVYLISLSPDALPQMADAFLSPQTAPDVKQKLGAALSCQTYWADQNKGQPWQSFHLGVFIGRQALNQLDLSHYAIRFASHTPYIQLDGSQINCYTGGSID